jgi:hypothetical protein
MMGDDATPVFLSKPCIQLDKGIMRLKMYVPEKYERAGAEPALTSQAAHGSTSGDLRERGLDATLAETFPCSDPLSSIPNPPMGEPGQ